MTRAPGRRGGLRLRAGLPPLGALAAAVAGVVYVGRVDPGVPGHYPICPFLALTGLYCPGCGGLRMTHALANGDVAAAAGFNVFLLLLGPFVAYAWIRWTVASLRGTRWRPAIARPPVLFTFIALMIVFWVVRNLPFGAFLAP
ncbi:DUF2752 domain-containing protein [Bailinhaonella thermotolerans]|uniref:DUF2752 domain-containing protein n=1 Tax=Bailinhaonella thermotolerans TaxID=1070861 RepID=A0A3A4A7A0_9ACTN|nr:DUF2752 domain-containing protein [Bailinhaonella thermotolerans]